MKAKPCLVCGEKLAPVPCHKKVGVIIGENDGFVFYIQKVAFYIHHECCKKLLLALVGYEE